VCPAPLLSEMKCALVSHRSLSSLVMALIVLLLPMFAECATKEDEPQ
jgi:hypothetical protein